MRDRQFLNYLLNKSERNATYTFSTYEMSYVLRHKILCLFIADTNLLTQR